MTAAPVLPGPLASTDWLAAHLGHPRLVVLDASWYLPSAGRDPRAEYLAAHIPGALWCDIDRFSDQVSPLPHMLPSPTALAAAFGALGVGDHDAVVVYDGSGANLSAARVWWMLRQLGHEAVAVLDGGMGKWRAEGRPVEAGEAQRPPAVFTARPHADWVLSQDDVARNVAEPRVQLVDARAADRYHGRVPEPRPGLRSGHIPGARNLPYQDLVAPDGTLRPTAELAARFAEAGIATSQPVAAYCGSGVSACAVLLALEVLGQRGELLYDGSWTEWGAEGAGQA